MTNGAITGAMYRCRHAGVIRLIARRMRGLLLLLNRRGVRCRRLSIARLRARCVGIRICVCPRKRCEGGAGFAVAMATNAARASVFLAGSTTSDRTLPRPGRISFRPCPRPRPYPPPRVRKSRNRDAQRKALPPNHTPGYRRASFRKRDLHPLRDAPASRNTHGRTQVKFVASSVPPVPLNFATCG
jgi:hypothetical protein